MNSKCCVQLSGFTSVHRPERVNQGTCPYDPYAPGESMESNCSMIEKIPPKGVSFSDFICTFAAPCYDFRLFSNCNTKISKKSDTAKS